MIWGIPDFLVYGGAVIAIIIGGVFYFLGLFSQAKGANTKMGEDALEFVNKAFEKKIAFLERQISEQTRQLDEQDKRLQAIENENRLLREVLQGRDQEAQEFQKKGLEALNVAVPEIVTLTKNTNQNVTRLVRSIENLVKALNVKTTVTTTTVPVQGQISE